MRESPFKHKRNMKIIHLETFLHLLVIIYFSSLIKVVK